MPAWQEGQGGCSATPNGNANTLGTPTAIIHWNVFEWDSPPEDWWWTSQKRRAAFQTQCNWTDQRVKQSLNWAIANPAEKEVTGIYLDVDVN